MVDWVNLMVLLFSTVLSTSKKCFNFYNFANRKVILSWNFSCYYDSKKKKIAFALILWIGFAYGNKYFGKKKEIRLKEYENA